MIRTWKANMDCMLPWRDFRRGETVEIDDSAVTPRFKNLFTCLTPDEVKKEEEAKKPDNDYNVMLARLKQAKITIPKHATKQVVTELFNTTLANGDLPNVVR